MRLTPRRSVLLLAMLLLAVPAFAGPTNNVILRGHLDEYAEYNDIWGYTAPNGDEYVLLGTTVGLSVVNVVDPDNPYETGFIPGPTSIWRDIKTYSHYAYVVNDQGGGGMRIVDLDDPENPVLVGTYTGGGHSQAHNIYIDVPTARAYLAGNNGSGGFIMLDLTFPETPTEITRWDTAYFHDIMVQDGVAYGSAINVDRLYVLDVSNPASIATLGTAEGYPAAFTHNAWVTGDNAYVMTTDETSSSSTRMWDLSTLPNLVQTDSYRPNTTTIPHNAHIDGDLAIISYYTLGVKIVDISDPFHLVEVAAFDSYPANDGGSFDGCWGAYPFFQTNPDLIAIADINTGLYLMEYKGPLGTVAGDVTENGGGGPIADATVRVVQTGVQTKTDGSGAYTIQDVAGLVDLEVSAYGYATEVVPATINTGVTTTLDVALDLLPSGSVSGTVSFGGSPIPNAAIEILTTPLSDVSDGSGDYAFAAVPAGTYTMRVSAFGYRPLETPVTVGAGGAVDLDVELSVALAANNFEIGTTGWSVSTTASSGAWEVADPQGTFDGATPVQPENDHSPSPGALCWVTGATAGGSLGSNDIDNGSTVLTSPSFPLASAEDPYVSYWKWYSTGVGNPNLDDWIVEMSTDGGGTWPIELENTQESTNAWVLVEFRLKDYTTPTNLTKFRFTARDIDTGGIVEAALDDFMVYDGVEQGGAVDAPVIGGGSAGRVELSRSYPNPFRSGQSAFVDLALPRGSDVEAVLVDVTGRRVATLAAGPLDAGVHRLEWDGRSAKGREMPAGVYFVRVETEEGVLSRKVLRLR